MISPPGKLELNWNNETSISAIQDSPETAAWLFEPQLDEIRPGYLGQPPPGGPKAPDTGLIESGFRLMALAPRADLTFDRSRRVKASRDFQRAKTKGQRLANGCLVANWLARPDTSESRLGVITSRDIGSAVQRNRARRLLRESFRLHQHEILGPLDLILVARRSIAGKVFRDVEKDFLSALRRARLLKGDPP
jgi:ribonuclease P protein component